MSLFIYALRAGSIAAAFALVLLAGCGSLKPLPSDTFYRLDIKPQAGARGAAQPWTDKLIRITKFSASGVHRERPIVYSRVGGVVVQQHRYHLWIDSPERMLQQELIDYLREANVAPRISGSNVDGAGFEVRGEIRQMDQVTGDGGVKVVVIINFELIATESQRSLILGREYQQLLPVTGSDMSATALAMSAAVGEIFERFLVDATQAVQNLAIRQSVSRNSH